MSNFYILTRHGGATGNGYTYFSEESAGFVKHMAFATPYPTPDYAAERANLFNLECDVSGVSMSVTHHERHCWAQPGRRGMRGND